MLLQRLGQFLQVWYYKWDWMKIRYNFKKIILECIHNISISPYNIRATISFSIPIGLWYLFHQNICCNNTWKQQSCLSVSLMFGWLCWRSARTTAMQRHLWHKHCKRCSFMWHHYRSLGKMKLTVFTNRMHPGFVQFLFRNISS